MWRKTDDSKLKSSSGASPAPVSSAPHPGAPPADSPNASAAVSHGIKMKGEISGQGDFFLDGEFEGSIHLADGLFTVGPHARVTADIQAREIIVRGEVIGSLKARERVHIWSTGKLTGEMETRGIAIEDGAVLHSKVATPRAGAAPAAAPAQSEPALTATTPSTVPQPAAPQATESQPPVLAPAPPEPAAPEASATEVAAGNDEQTQLFSPEASQRSKRAAASASGTPSPPNSNPPEP